MDFDLDYVKTLLRVDEGWDEDRIQLLINSVGKYVETTTGIPEEKQKGIPLVNVLKGYLVRLWYDDGNGTGDMQRAIDSLTKTLTVIGREV